MRVAGIFRALTGSLFAACAPGLATAQVGPTRSAAATATVEVYAPLNFTAGPQLAFGLVKSTGAPGAVTVKPEGVRFVEGGAEMLGSGPCHLSFCEDDTHTSASTSASYWGPGMFDISGSPGVSYRVNLPDSVQASFRTPSAGRIPALIARDFRVLSRSTGAAQGQLDATGRDSFRIGGTLMVPSEGQAAASYRVNLPIQVEYQ